MFRKQLEATPCGSGSADEKPKDDILAGMTAVVTVRLAEPQFEGQTKEVLGTNAVRAIVAKVVETELTDRLTSTKRGNKANNSSSRRSSAAWWWWRRLELEVGDCGK